MARIKKVNNDNSGQTRRPATTPENYENQMISLATDLAKKQLMDGTASAQVVTHFLKLGTTRERLEQEKLRRENSLLIAKEENLASGKRIEALYEEAMTAMREYNGQAPNYDEDDDEN